MEAITWADFEKVELRAGTITEVKPFPKARKPAWQVQVDFGAEIGLRWSSAQITALYSATDLIGRQVVAVLNFPKKQIANFFSECLITGFSDADGHIVLTAVERPVPNGAKLM